MKQNKRDLFTYLNLLMTLWPLREWSSGAEETEKTKNHSKPGEHIPIDWRRVEIIIDYFDLLSAQTGII